MLVLAIALGADHAGGPAALILLVGLAAALAVALNLDWQAGRRSSCPHAAGFVWFGAVAMFIRDGQGLSAPAGSAASVADALIRLYANTGARLSEVGMLLVTDVNMNTESVLFHGQGAKDRRVRFGPKTARALSRYLRARDNHRGAALPNVWLADRGVAPLTPNGIRIRLKRLGAAAGVPDLHAHRWRHSFAHEWKLAGADTGDLMLLLGWASDDMPRRYGASAAAERAMATQQHIGTGERV